MIKNYFTLAFRNILKRKAYSFINIIGLATGVAVCLVILRYVDFQLSYDSFHHKADHIFRAITSYYRNGEKTSTGVLTGYALGPILANEIPEVKAYVRTHPMYGGAVISNNDAKDPLRFQENDIQYVDSTFFDVFTYTAIQGDLSTALDDPASMVITKSSAKKYFGRVEDAVGKTLQVSGGWAPGDFEIKAVVEDVPENSHFEFSFLMPMNKLLEGQQYKQDDGWGWQNFVTYFELHPNVNTAAAEKKAMAHVQKIRAEEMKRSGVNQELKFQPIQEIHLTPGLDLDSSATIGINTIYFFILISIFIMAIAWINYINLSTARAMERAREVGIKKAVGAFRSQLMTQFIVESVLVNFIAVSLAVLLAVLLLPVLGGIVEKHFSFDFSDRRLWIVLTGLFLVGSFVSGSYPAFVLSSFKTSMILKGTERVGEKFSLRKALVVFQFVASLVLIAGTFTIYRQVVFMRAQDKGLTMDQMLIIDGPRVYDKEGINERIISFKNELKNLPSVDKVATSATIPGGGFNWGTSMRKEGDPVESNKSGNVTWVDTDFISTYGIELLAGKLWNPDVASDMQSTLVNEAALLTFGLGTPDEALTKRIILGNDTVAILGVLKNYHWNSLKLAHSPILLAPSKISRSKFSVHISAGGSMQETVKNVEALFKESFPGNPFDYYFLDDFFNRQYKDEQQFASIFSMFAILAIIIACLGLWGLASFTTTQKLKEISIRKVLGASTSSIMSLLSMQFMKLVFIASIIAAPLMWYGIDRWLDSFAFRIGIGWELFIVPALTLAVVALATVSFQIFRGANSNPARILRTE